MSKPRWVLKEVVIAAHEEMLFQHGGIDGIRDEGILESALGRPQNLYAYGNPDLFDLAAAYAFGIAKNHPFLDGNKRTAFITAYIFLGLNGFELSASEATATIHVLALAAGEVPEKEFSRWLEANSVPH